MAKKADISSADTHDTDDVPLSAVKPIEETGVNNGLGLERIIPAAPAAKPAAKKVEKAASGDADDLPTDTTQPDTEKKPVPEKDPKTGRFLPSKSKPADPPVDDALPNDDNETLKKRLKDTRDWASKVNKTNHELEGKQRALEAKLAILEQKLDGTYIEPEKPEVDPAELEKLEQRVKVSRAVAEQLYGPEKVQEWIYDEDSPYRQLEQADPFIKARVFKAEQPVMEAIHQLKWKGFTDKYGTDPDKVVETIYQEAHTEFVQNLKQKGLKTKTVEDVGGLSDTRGGRVESKSDAKTDRVELASVFTNFPTGHF